jgi:hypothetical protein
MFAWGVAQAVFLAKSSIVAPPSLLQLTLDVLGCTLVGALVALGLSWVLATPLLRRLTPLRLLAGAVGVGIYLTTMTVAANLGLSTGPWSSVTRSTFILSTTLLSVVLGWVVATDPFGLIKTSDRIYLSPADFAALPAADQAELIPDSAESAAPKGPRSKG